jgi:hypothetical protein
MSNENNQQLVTVQPVQGGAISLVVEPQALIDRTRQVKQVVAEVMQKDVHYGTIPGTKGLSLLKPGAEILMSAFNIGIDPVVEDLSDKGEVHYRVKATGIALATGLPLGSGVGECTSREEKYAWKKANSDQEFNDAHPSRRRVKHKPRWQGSKVVGTYTELQVRMDPYDKANTILKMAKKRATTDLILSLLAVSDMFEGEGDMNPYQQNQANPTPAPAQEYQQFTNQPPQQPAPPPQYETVPTAESVVPPAPKPGSKFADQNQVQMMETAAKNAGLELADVVELLQIPDVKFIPKTRIDSILDYIRVAASGPEQLEQENG